MSRPGFLELVGRTCIPDVLKFVWHYETFWQSQLLATRHDLALTSFSLNVLSNGYSSTQVGYPVRLDNSTDNWLPGREEPT